MFRETIPGRWTSVGTGTFSVVWQFIARDRACQPHAAERLQIHHRSVKYRGARHCYTAGHDLRYQDTVGRDPTLPHGRCEYQLRKRRSAAGAEQTAADAAKCTLRSVYGNRQHEQSIRQMQRILTTLIRLWSLDNGNVALNISLQDYLEDNEFKHIIN